MKDVSQTKPTYPPTELGKSARLKIPQPAPLVEDTAEIAETVTHAATPVPTGYRSTSSFVLASAMLLVMAISIAATVQAYRNFTAPQTTSGSVLGTESAATTKSTITPTAPSREELPLNEQSGDESSLPSDEIGEFYTNSLGMQFARIPAGRFLMGCSETNDTIRRDFPRVKRDVGEEQPQHLVKLTSPFYLGRHEVTQAQFEAVMHAQPSFFSAQGHLPEKVKHLKDTGDLPVENVTWENAVEFCRRISALPDERKNGMLYRLPTEAEWEYACRAGEVGRYGLPNDIPLDKFAWNRANSGSIPHPVGKLRPNSWGLFDMHGNVWEWCADYASTKYYASSPTENPWNQTEDENGQRVIRGGCYQRESTTGEHRSSARDFLNEQWSASQTGFRVYCETPMMRAID